MLLLIISGGKGTADDLSMNMDVVLSGSERKSSGKTSTSSGLSQIYFMGFNKTLTSTLRFSGDIRASQTKTESNAKTTESTAVRPSLFLNMNNEYFLLNAGYRSNFLPFLSIGDGIHSSTKNTDFSTSPAGFPSLRLSYNETKSKDDLTVSKVDTKQSNVNASTNYNIFGVSMAYNFTRTESNDFVNQSKQENPRHFGTMSYNNSFFERKLNYSLNAGMSKATSKNRSLSGIPTTFDEKKDALNGLYSEDSLPADGALSDSTSLIDGNTVSVAVSDSSNEIDLNGSNRNIGIKLKQKEIIKTIYLYLSAIDPDIVSINFDWEVYYSNDTTGSTWTFAPSTSSYDDTNKRFEFQITSPQSAVFFKVVNKMSDPLAKKIDVSEIEAIGSISETPSVLVTSTTDRQFGGLNLNWRATKKINVTYNVNYDRSQQSLIDLTNQNINQGITASYAISKKLSLFSGYQNQRSSSSGNSDTGSNSYLLSISTNPIETINGSISFNRTESLLDGDIISESNSSNVNTFYKLYHGVGLGLGFNINTSKSSGSESKTMSTNWNLNLKPRNNINIVVNGSASASTTETEGNETSSTSKNLRSAINFNPSRYLTFTANLDFLPERKENFSVNTRLPGSLQLNVTYNRSDSGSETVGGTMSWGVSRHIFISSSYRKTFVHNDSKDTSSSYNLLFSIRK